MSNMTPYVTGNELISNPQSLWVGDANLRQLKSIYGNGLNDLEFQTFIMQGMSTGLNPFLKEIWCHKIGGQLCIFIARDGYRKCAQKHPEYDYHMVDSIYENDEFYVTDGKMTHKYKLSDRGNLIAAYCRVKRRSSSQEQYVIVQLREYNKNQSVWKEKPETMIKKVAEAQALRMAFQDVLAGTYHEDEQWKVEKETKTTLTHQYKGVDGLKVKLGLMEEPIAGANRYTDETIKDAEIIIDDIHTQQYDIDSIKFLIESSTTRQELNEVGKKIRSFPEDERESLKDIYRKRLQEIVANEPEAVS